MAFLKKLFKKETPHSLSTARSAEKKLSTKSEGEAIKSPAKRGNAVWGVIRGAHVTEKTSGFGENKYAFLVSPEANKLKIKNAVGSRYGVDVSAVNIVNIPGKERRRGRQIGWRAGYKKAIVTLHKGQSIEMQ